MDLVDIQSLEDGVASILTMDDGEDGVVSILTMDDGEDGAVTILTMDDGDGAVIRTFKTKENILEKKLFSIFFFCYVKKFVGDYKDDSGNKNK